MRDRINDGVRPGSIPGFSRGHECGCAKTGECRCDTCARKAESALHSWIGVPADRPRSIMVTDQEQKITSFESPGEALTVAQEIDPFYVGLWTNTIDSEFVATSPIRNLRDKFYASDSGTSDSTATVVNQVSAIGVPIVAVVEDKCGPDITEWLVSTLTANAKEAHDYAKSHGKVKTLKWFKDKVNIRQPWDYKSKDFSAGPECPTPTCQPTVEICKICLHKEFIGNMVFAYAGAAAGFWLNTLLAGSEFAATKPASDVEVDPFTGDRRIIPNKLQTAFNQWAGFGISFLSGGLLSMSDEESDRDVIRIFYDLFDLVGGIDGFGSMGGGLHSPALCLRLEAALKKMPNKKEEQEHCKLCGVEFKGFGAPDSRPSGK